MGKRGENIYKRKDGRWEGRYIKARDSKNKAKYGYVYASTYAEVKKRLFVCQTTNNFADDLIINDNVLYSDIATSWLNSSCFKVKESTYAHYYFLIHSHILPMLGDYPINKITTQVIENKLQVLLKAGRKDGRGGLAPKTVTDIIAIIKSTIEYARYNDYSVVCNLSRLTVKKSEEEIRVLSLEEQIRLSNSLTHPVVFENVGILLALYTGIRIGELCALKWENIDLEMGVLKIRKTMQRIQNTDSKAVRRTKIIISEPKSHSSVRDIPLPQFLVDILKKYKTTNQAFFLTGDTKKYIEPRTMQNRFKRCAEDVGLENINFHALRHTFATRCVELDFDVKTLSEILGHANVNITLNRYVHASMEFKRSNMNKLAKVANY